MANSLLGWLGGGLYGQVNEDPSTPQIDTSQVAQQMAAAQQARQTQQQGIGLTTQMAEGKGPSAAQAMLDAQTKQLEANNNALASSGSGNVGQGAARRSAIMANSQIGAQAGGNAAIARAQEQMGAIGALGQEATAQRGQDISGAGLQENLATAQAGLQEDTNKLQEQSQAQNQNSNEGFLSSAAGAVAGAAMLASDPDAKYGVASADEETHPFVAEVRGKHSHLYQDSGYTGLNEGPLSVSSPPQAKTNVSSASDDGPSTSQYVAGALKGFSDPKSVGTNSFKQEMGMNKGATKGAATNGPVADVSPYVSDSFQNAKEKVNAPSNMYADPGQAQVMAPLPKYLEDYVSGVGSGQTLSSPPQAKKDVLPSDEEIGGLQDQLRAEKVGILQQLDYHQPEEHLLSRPGEKESTEVSPVVPGSLSERTGSGLEYLDRNGRVPGKLQRQVADDTRGAPAFTPEGQGLRMGPEDWYRLQQHLKTAGPSDTDLHNIDEARYLFRHPDQTIANYKPGETEEETVVAESKPSAARHMVSSSPQAKIGAKAGNVGNALRNLHPYSFQYKDPHNEPIPNPSGGERFFGVMTTDLKKNPITRNMVQNRGQGAMEKISVPAATSFNLAGEAHLQKRQDDHEARLGALEKMMRSVAAKKGRRGL